MWTALTSHVHIGIHARQRSQTGYSKQLLNQVVRTSNGLLTMTAMMLANLGGIGDASKVLGAIQLAYRDCLPTLLK